MCSRTLNAYRENLWANSLGLLFSLSFVVSFCQCSFLVLPSLITHSTGRAISALFIESLGGFGGLCAPVNSGVRLLLVFQGDR
jgi:hypothetical protein